MPQFDQVTFLTQIVNLGLCFFGFYFAFVFYFLPSLSASLKLRKIFKDLPS